MIQKKENIFNGKLILQIRKDSRAIIIGIGLFLMASVGL